MPNVLRLRRTPNPPEPNRNSEAIYAASDGTLKQVDPDGNESDLGGGGGGSQPMLTVTVPLTNADIIALGTEVAFEVLAAPAVGKFYNIIFGLICIDASAGAYGNIDANPTIGLQHSGASIGVTSQQMITALLGGDDVAAWLPISPVPTYGDASPDEPLTLFMANGGAGALTGGNAANSGFVKVWYSLEDFPS